MSDAEQRTELRTPLVIATEQRAAVLHRLRQYDADHRGVALRRSDLLTELDQWCTVYDSLQRDRERGAALAVQQELLSHQGQMTGGELGMSHRLDDFIAAVEGEPIVPARSGDMGWICSCYRYALNGETCECGKTEADS